MQYSKKIIALFLTVCLLVTSLCVPVSAADSGTMLYNGVELPDIDSVWTDKQTYPYSFIIEYSGGIIYVVCADSPYYLSSTNFIQSRNAPVTYVTGFINSEYKAWQGIGSNTAARGDSWSISSLIWTSHDFLSADGSVYLAASTPVHLNTSVGTMTHYTGHFGSDYSNTTFHVDGLSASDTYFIRGYCYQDSSLVMTADSPAWNGPGTYCTVEFSGLSPSTTYDFEFVLYVNDKETSVTYTKSVTTLEASSGGDSGNGGGSDDGSGSSGSCTECPSILTAILSAISAQTNFLSTWQQTWTTRMDSLESTLSKLIPVPDPTETALKDATKETTQAVVDKVFADDSAAKVTASDIGDMADSGKEVVNAFDTGTTVGDFFSVFTDYVFTGWFSEETRANLDSVNSVSTFGLDDDPYNHDSYNKNMEALDKFLERSGKVND